MGGLDGFSSALNKGKIILIEDTVSDDDNQVASLDISADVSDAPTLEPTNIYTVVRASGIDYFGLYFCCFACHVCNVHVFFSSCLQLLYANFTFTAT